MFSFRSNESDWTVDGLMGVSGDWYMNADRQSTSSKWRHRFS